MLIVRLIAAPRVQYGVVDALSWLSINTPTCRVVVCLALLACPRVHLDVSPVLVPSVGVSIRVDHRSLWSLCVQYGVVDALSWLNIDTPAHRYSRCDIYSYAVCTVQRFPCVCAVRWGVNIGVNPWNQFRVAIPTPKFAINKCQQSIRFTIIEDTLSWLSITTPSRPHSWLSITTPTRLH